MLSRNLPNPFEINSASVGFSDLEPWTITVNEETVEWRPEVPYLFPITSNAYEIIESIQSIAQFTQDEEPLARTFRASPKGPILLNDLSNPYSVLYFSFLCFDFEDWDRGAGEEIDPENLATLSNSAPRLDLLWANLT